jgi:hypothetical protein
MTKRLKVLVNAHHRVEDFRPYSVNFVDTKDAKANLIKAFNLVIKREANWNGWYDSYGDLEGKAKQVGQAIETLVNEDKKEVIVFGVDYDGNDKPIDSKQVGLVIWSTMEGEVTNYGFGIAHSENSEVTINDTDKYDNKWFAYE